MLEFCHADVNCSLVPILYDISVVFQTGEITTVIGPNGCGKTTLLQCLNGSSKVTSGSIRLDDMDYLAMPLKERARRLSFLPQVRTIIPALPVRTLVEHGRFPHLGFTRRKSQKDIAIVEKAMNFAHVSPYAAQYADTLSGGIRQRAFFAMSLAQDCDYIVLDEPTTYLDLNGQREFMEMIIQLKKQGKTIILVLHDLGQALRISDTLVIMQDRKIAATATPKECLQQHIIEDVFDIRIKEFSDDEGSYYFFY
ncbi:MAG: ABC transporter ATP-binding protein [Lachnospiraceae bacterium]|nr:ABC transporter ATP-binding protein [Lachnospiraceae bacterium]MDE7417701.1 ABC transporter ATP-binding protein [Lachnospiraceae bacterium]